MNTLTDKALLAIAIFSLGAPVLVLAAGSDVTLTTDAVISVNGITVNVSGSSATIQSITVNSTDFTVTLASGSSMTITAPGLNQLGNDLNSDVSANACTGSVSSLTLSYSGAGTVTNTITPSATLCTGTGGGGSSSGSSGSTSSGSSGGGGGPYVPPVLPASATTSAAGAPSAAGVFSVNMTVGSRGSAVSILQAWLIAHGYAIPSVSSRAAPAGYFGSQTKTAVQKYQADQGIPPTGFVGPLTIASLNGAIKGTVAAAACPEGFTCTAVAVPAFDRSFGLGDTGADVKALQQYLNAHDFPVAPSGPGSSGHETLSFGPATKNALAAFQRSKGISPATGYFGPKTKAAIVAQ